MGGAVSSGRDNGELVDNLKGSNYIRTPQVEAAFRAVDRAHYMPLDSHNLAYKDLAWKSGQLHLSAPCIYSEVMEGLELTKGLTFLNVGSGTGYLSTMVGLLLGSRGVNHGIEIHQVVLDYANKRLAEFLSRSPAVDEFHFCVPSFLEGNGLCLPLGSMRYDRVYCGASCPEEYEAYFKQLINVGGVLVMPLNDCLLQVRRTSETEWTSRSLLNVSFASLLVPSKEECSCFMPAMSVSPTSLQVMVRGVIRDALHRELLRRHPHLREPPARPLLKKPCSRRICIPIEDDSDMELDGLHDLDRAGGAGEMNALLSLVLSMGQNRVAGALRFDHNDSPSDSDDSSGSRSRSRSTPPHSPPHSPDAPAANAGDAADRPAEDENADKVDTELKSPDAPMSDTMDTIELNEPQVPEGQEPSSSVADTSSGAQDAPSAEPRSLGAESGIAFSTAAWGESEGARGEGAEEEKGEAEAAEDAEEAGRRRARSGKRAKLDSGIGEEASPHRRGSSRSSPDMVHLNHDAGTCRRRVMKRSRPPLTDDSSASSEDSSSSAESAPAPPRHKQRRGAPPDACQLRRARISQLLQGSVACLPLPAPLQRYVNLDRPLH